MKKNVSLEVLIATPPTTKCEETIQVLEEMVGRHPDEARLVVFRRGIDFVPAEMQMKELVSEEALVQKTASLQMRTLITKGRAVPTVIVNDEVFSTSDVPKLEDLEARVQEILRSNATKEEIGH